MRGGVADARPRRPKRRLRGVSRPAGTCLAVRRVPQDRPISEEVQGSRLALKGRLRSDASDDDVAAWIRGVWETRDDRYSEIRSSHTTSTERVEMSYIGG